jgi:soluble lytic murein transglycosylase-like protein
MLLRGPVTTDTNQINDVCVMIASARESDAADADQAAQERQARKNAEARANEIEREQAHQASVARHSAYAYTQTGNPGHPIAQLPPEALAVYTPYRRFIANYNRHLNDIEVDTITTSILYYSAREHLDPRLVIAMIMAESSFNINSTSNKGAIGLGQLMPGTAAGLGVSNPYDPIQNVGGSVILLANHVRKYGGVGPGGIVPLNTLLLSMAAYNAGSGAVRKYGGVPPYRETQKYVRRVATFYRYLCGG